MRFVFRPRSWVRRLGNCVMKQHQLRAQAGAAPANFITAYIRESIEKDRDGRSSPRSVAPSHAIDVMWSKGFSHGQLLYSFNTQKELATRVFLQEARLLMQGDSDDEETLKKR